MSIAASIVIPAYNQSSSLACCLKSLFIQTADPTTYEIIVVDDGSTDETPELIKELKPQAPCAFTYIWHQNSGRSYTRNTGAKTAQGHYVIFLDGDMVVRREFVTDHLAGHKQPNLVVNGPVVNVTSLNPSTWPDKVHDFSRAFFATGNVSVEREKLLAAGLFDEDFVEYGWEDLELGLRLKNLGLKATKALSACSFHFQYPLTYDKIPNLIKKEKERGHTAVLFYRKMPTFEVQMMTLITPVFFGLDWFLSLFNWPEWPSTFKLLAQMDRTGHRVLFNILVALVKNHAYADGIHEELARNPLVINSKAKKRK